MPDRIKEHVTVRDRTCVFPCTRPAAAATGPHPRPQQPRRATCSNIAPLCRTHHRLKTHTPWTYTTLDPGTYLWTSPHGYHYLRNTEGTQDVTADRPRRTKPDT